MVRRKNLEIFKQGKENGMLPSQTVDVYYETKFLA
jgi:hypothetical protein